MSHIHGCGHVNNVRNGLTFGAIDLRMVWLPVKYDQQCVDVAMEWE